MTTYRILCRSGEILASDRDSFGQLDGSRVRAADLTTANTIPGRGRVLSVRAIPPADGILACSVCAALVDDLHALKEAMGRALGGITRERVRQLIWSRGLRQRWAEKQQARRASRASEKAAVRTAKYLSGVSGNRQRIINEAVKRGLRIEVPSRSVNQSGPAGFRLFIEGVPIAVHRINKPPWHPPASAADHPGYYHVNATPHALITDWPIAEEWADFRVLLSGTAHGLTVVGRKKESAASTAPPSTPATPPPVPPTPRPTAPTPTPAARPSATGWRRRGPRWWR